jgi:hypothetical protein
MPTGGNKQSMERKATTCPTLKSVLLGEQLQNSHEDHQRDLMNRFMGVKGYALCVKLPISEI